MFDLEEWSWTQVITVMTSDLMEKECQLSLEAPQSRWTEEELAAPRLLPQREEELASSWQLAASS